MEATTTPRGSAAIPSRPLPVLLDPSAPTATYHTIDRPPTCTSLPARELHPPPHGTDAGADRVHAMTGTRAAARRRQPRSRARGRAAPGGREPQLLQQVSTGRPGERSLHDPVAGRVRGRDAGADSHPEPLVASDTDGHWDLYERAADGTTAFVRPGLIDTPAFYGGVRRISARSVFFETGAGWSRRTTTTASPRIRPTTPARTCTSMRTAPRPSCRPAPRAATASTRRASRTSPRTAPGCCSPTPNRWWPATPTPRPTSICGPGADDTVSTGTAGGNGSFVRSIAACRRTARTCSSRPPRARAADTDSSGDVYERFNGTTTLVSPGRRAATAPTTRRSAVRRATAPACSSRRRSRWSPPTPTVRSTCTSGRAAPPR